MKRGLIILGVLMAVAIGALFTVAAKYERKVRVGSSFEGVAIGGMRDDEAKAALDAWWREREQRAVTFQIAGASPVVIPVARLGIGFDRTATLAKIPFDDFWQATFARLGKAVEKVDYDAVLTESGRPQVTAVVEAVRKVSPPRVPARVVYRGGVFTREPEQVGIAVQVDELMRRASEAARLGNPSVEVPISKDKAKVSDEALAAIREVASEFTTKFSTRQGSRCANIKLASSKIDGLVLAPGERFSFNGTVGRRTAKAGFQIAGVYANGKHDFDIGGGICQVSTTLYNAALFANLKVVRRQNHSMPVAYVPVGRDATVDYGSADLVFENNLQIPIAINAEYRPGSLTFRILGQKDPTLGIEIAYSDATSWDMPVKTVPDPSLPAGTKKVVEKGSRGHSVNTYRVVLRDGAEVKREPLGKSYYRGGTRIIAVGTKAAAPADPAPPEEEPEV